MDVLYYLFAAIVLLIAIQAAISIWTPRAFWVRASAVALTIALMPLLYLTLTLLLSRPKPVSFEWYERNAARATVLSVSFDEGNAIYLWLVLGGSVEPRAYALPWRQQTAEHLEDTLNAVAQNGGALVLKDPFTRRSEMESQGLSLEIVPPPSMPLKRPPPPPRVFNPRADEI